MNQQQFQQDFLRKMYLIQLLRQMEQQQMQQGGQGQPQQEQKQGPDVKEAAKTAKDGYSLWKDLFGGTAAEEASRNGINALNKPEAAPTSAPTQTMQIPRANSSITPEMNTAWNSGATPRSMPTTEMLQPVGSGPTPGSTMMSDGSTVMSNGNVQLKDGSVFTKDGVQVQKGTATGPGTLQNSMAGAAAALAVYNAYSAYKDPNLTQAQKNTAYAKSAASGLQAYNSSSLGYQNPYLGAGASVLSGAAGVYGAMNNKMTTNEQKATRAQQEAALAVADFYTGGLASMAEGALRKNKTTAGILEKFDRLDQKTNPFTILAGKYGLFGQDKWNTEVLKMSKLQQKGINVPQSIMESLPTKKGRGMDELVALEEQKAKEGKWNNVAFAKSRDVKDLKPEDIWGYAGFFQKYGNDWLGKFSEDQRRAVAQKALDTGAVNEHHGTIDINWSPEIEQAANSPVAAQPTNTTPSTPATTMQIPRTGRRAPDYKPGPRRF